MLAEPAVAHEGKGGEESQTKIAALRMTVVPYRVNDTSIVCWLLLLQ